jgi:two-component system C4-dicarboxylate transport response regulator DctD
MVASFAPRLGKATPDIADEAFEQLEHYSWPGNVRELENVVKRTLTELDDTTIRSFFISGTGAARMGKERRLLEELLQRNGGNLSQVARALGVSRPTLYKRLQQHGLAPDSFRSIGADPEFPSSGSEPADD